MNQESRIKNLTVIASEAKQSLNIKSKIKSQNSKVKIKIQKSKVIYLIENWIIEN